MVLDQQGLLTPQGTIGELYIGGDGLARGYLNRPSLTAERFIENPYYDATHPSSFARLYRTGDLVRYLPDGNLAFIGRVDHQVKIRGFRIELGEVEVQLTAQEGVDSALVMAKEWVGSQQLVGYIKPTTALDEDAHVTFASAVKSELSSQLPEHMVPSILMVVTEWPLTSNGKIDRQALPTPDGLALQGEYIAAQTDTEKALVDVCSSLLAIEADKISTTANFFELGGHSLLVMKLIGQASKHGLRLEAQDVFSTHDLRALASLHDAQWLQRNAHAFVAPENLIPAQCQHITPEMLTLVTLSQEEITQIAEKVPNGMENIEDIYPLGPLQAGVFYTHMTSEGHDPYVTPKLFKVRDQAALESFIQGMEFLIQRHDVLRTLVLHEGLSEPLQVVCKEVPVPVTWLDFPEEVDVSAAMTEQSLPEHQWLDVTQAPLFHIKVAQDKEQGYYLLLQMHHLITDHVSLEIIHRELNVFYAGQAETLPAVQPYRNFIAYTANQLEQQHAEAYFKAKLGDVEETAAPFGLTDVLHDGLRVEELAEQVPDDIAQAVRALSRQLKVSPATLFPAFSIPKIPITISNERSTHKPTKVSGLTP